MRSSPPDVPPGQVPVGQVTNGAPAAGNARPTLTVRLADLASFTADIVTAVLEGAPFDRARTTGRGAARLSSA